MLCQREVPTHVHLRDARLAGEPRPGARRRAVEDVLLLGVHAARMDMSTRDRQLDESLGLNCAWYADILLTLTAGD